MSNGQMAGTQTMKLPSIAQFLPEGEVLLFLLLGVSLTFPGMLKKFHLQMKMPSEGKEGTR